MVVGALVGRMRDLARHLSEEVRKLKETEDEIAVADEVSRIVTSTLEIGVVYERFANEVKKLVDWDMMNISIMDDEAGQAVAQYFYGEASEHLQAGFKSPIPGTLGELVRDEGRTVIVKDGEFSRNLSREVDALNAGFRSAILVPMFAGGRVFGSLSLRNRKPNAFGERERRIMERLASQIGPAMENARLHQETLAESRLAMSSLAQLKAVLEGVGAGILLIGPKREILWMNQRFTELIGIDRVEGHTFTDGGVDGGDGDSGYDLRRWGAHCLADPEAFFAAKDRVYYDR